MNPLAAIFLSGILTLYFANPVTFGGSVSVVDGNGIEWVSSFTIQEGREVKIGMEQTGAESQLQGVYSAAAGVFVNQATNTPSSQITDHPLDHKPPSWWLTDDHLPEPN